MSKDKYPSIFSPQMETIVFIILQIFYATRTVLKIGVYTTDIVIGFNRQKIKSLTVATYTDQAWSITKFHLNFLRTLNRLSVGNQEA